MVYISGTYLPVHRLWSMNFFMPFPIYISFAAGLSKGDSNIQLKKKIRD